MNDKRKYWTIMVSPETGRRLHDLCAVMLYKKMDMVARALELWEATYAPPGTPAGNALQAIRANQSSEIEMRMVDDHYSTISKPIE